jgi:hypothetical protein
MDNPEILEALGTHDTGGKQTKHKNTTPLLLFDLFFSVLYH